MSENKTKDSDKKKEHSPVSPPPERIEDKKTPDEKQNKTSSRLKGIGQLLLVVFNIIMIFILWKQTNIMSADLRAWITVEESNITEFGEGKPIFTRVKFVNSGKSPALKVFTFANLEIRDTPVPEPMPPLPTDGAGSRAVLGPQSTYTIALKLDKQTTQTIQEIIAGQKKVYVWGIVEYDDIFGVRHRTKFCLVNSSWTKNFNACGNNNDVYDVSK